MDLSIEKLYEFAKLCGMKNKSVEELNKVIEGVKKILGDKLETKEVSVCEFDGIKHVEVNALGEHFYISNDELNGVCTYNDALGKCKALGLDMPNVRQWHLILILFDEINRKLTEIGASPLSKRDYWVKCKPVREKVLSVSLEIKAMERSLEYGNNFIRPIKKL